MMACRSEERDEAHGEDAPRDDGRVWMEAEMAKKGQAPACSSNASVMLVKASSFFLLFLDHLIMFDSIPDVDSFGLFVKN
jgi:hypothetical protein